MIALILALLFLLPANNECHLGGADRAVVTRYDRPSREASITDAEWMAVPTTWESSQPWEVIIDLYRYSATRYAWVVYYAGDTPLHYIDVKRGDGVLYAIVMPSDRNTDNRHGCVIVADDLDGYVETWLDFVIR